jgi:hypothetical protein
MKVLAPDTTPLFPDLEAEFDAYVVDAVKAKSFVHSGAFISRNEELCIAICTDLLSGVSRRVIAQRYEVSRNSVNVIREIMDARGELEPLKKEIARRLDRCVIYSLENLEHALEKDGIAHGQLPIATAVLLDKKAALEGQPTSRIEHITTRRITHEEVNAWLDTLPSANPVPALEDSRPSDSASADSTPEAPASQDDTKPDHD